MIGEAATLRRGPTGSEEPGSGTGTSSGKRSSLAAAVHRSGSLAAASAALIFAADASAQAVTEWRTPAGVPIAIAEVAGGDVEHLAAVVPPTAAPPAALAGWPTAVTARRGALIWSLRVPATLASSAAAELVAALAPVGAAAVVAVGPAPARELSGSLGALAALPAALDVRPPCALADGRIEVVRGAPERVELQLGAPSPADPRFESVPLAAALLDARLAARLPRAHAAVETRDGCFRLVVRAEAGDDGVRLTLERLRQVLAAAAAEPISPPQGEAAAVMLRRAAAQRAGDGAAAALSLAERLAQGGRAAAAFVVPQPSPAALAELLRELIVGRAGMATLTEAERRARDEAPETLPNGVIVQPRWIPDDVAVVAFAFAGVAPASGAALAGSLAERLASAGWPARPGEAAGIATLAVTLPPRELADALEVAVEVLIAAPVAALPADLGGEVAAALGLRGAPAAETLAVALALPPEAEEGVEAARKFLAELPGGGLRSSGLGAASALSWTPGDGTPRLAAVLELQPSPAAWLAGEVLIARAAAPPFTRGAWLAPPGGLAVALSAEGEAHVPALDARLAAAWPRLAAPPSAEELAAAGRRLYARLYGDLEQATVRAALRALLPALPSEVALLAPDAGEVAGVLVQLPAWPAVRRLARGPGPQVVTPPVRESR